MNITSIMKDNLILIVPAIIKNKVIKEISNLDILYSYKIFSEEELKSLLCFSYDLKAVDYIVKSLKVKIDVAFKYLDTMAYITKNSYNSPKLNTLVSLKNELFSLGYIYENDYKAFFQNKEILVYGFDVIDKKLLFLLNKIETPYQIIDSNNDLKLVDCVYHFNCLDDEVDGLCYQISNLLNKTVDINKIKICNANSDYLFSLKRHFKMYNIPINIKNSNSLYSLLSIKDFYDKACASSLNEALSYFLTTYPNQENIYLLLLNICSKLSELDSLDLSFLKYLLKKEQIPTTLYKDAIEIIDPSNLYIDDEYIFVLSLNQGIYPKIHMDNDLISDKEKQELLIDTSYDLNLKAKSQFSKLLTKSKNIILSFKDKSNFSAFSKAFIIDDENLKVIDFKKDCLTSYSSLSDKLFLAKNLDSIYQVSNDTTLKILLNNYDLEYKTFSNKFKPFDPKKIVSLIDKKNINLSYSAIANYYECGFKFYLANILKIDIFEPSMAAMLGTAFHAVLEDSYTVGFDFESSFDFQKDKIEDVVTKLYFEKYKLILKDIIDINKQNIEISSLKQVINEMEVIVSFTDPININFKGFIDKVMYNEIDGITYLALIDYKTSRPVIDVGLVKHGFSMQLPVYLYLIKKTKQFKDSVVCGFYLQRLVPKSFTANTDFYNHLRNEIKLDGYSNSSRNIISILDPNYENSKMIKNMSITKSTNEFNRFAKLLSSKQMDEVALQIESKIKEVIDNICKCNFPISPKMLNGTCQSCTFCNFKEVCCYTHDDLVYLDDKMEDGGEYNGI